ncbi:MAG: MlaD protein [Verrucomicrobiota bacterium]|jgi:ABC-type transporter Mla subunit MlaD
MPLQDLTPQLRTRLNRLERAVALFVLVATLLMVAGLYFYVRRTAERKGWFVVKLPYFTFVDSAAGLKVGDPVKMMGFDVGEVTAIAAQPPGDAYNIFVAFTIREPNNGYLWDDSKVRVVSKDLLGSRSLEVTKGTNGIPIYYFHPMSTQDLAEIRAELEQTDPPARLFLAQEIWDPARRELLERANQPVTPALVRRLESLGVSSVLVLDKAETLPRPTHLWKDQEGAYVSVDRPEFKGYFLPPDEQPAVTEVAGRMLDQVKLALPNILALTNRIQRLLDESADAAAGAGSLLTAAQPALTNLLVITRQLTNAQGGLGQWLLPPELNTNLNQALRSADGTLVSASLLLTNTDARVAELTTSLAAALVQLAGVTSNLHQQVNVNTNILSSISSLIVDTDDLVQGLKRHWLLRSAFKEKAPDKAKERAGDKAAEPNRPAGPGAGRATSPNASGR